MATPIFVQYNEDMKRYERIDPASLPIDIYEVLPMWKTQDIREDLREIDAALEELAKSKEDDLRRCL